MVIKIKKISKPTEMTFLNPLRLTLEIFEAFPVIVVNDFLLPIKI